MATSRLEGARGEERGALRGIRSRDMIGAITVSCSSVGGQLRHSQIKYGVCTLYDKQLG